MNDGRFDLRCEGDKTTKESIVQRIRLDIWGAGRRQQPKGFWTLGSMVTPALHREIAVDPVWIGLDVGADETAVCATNDRGTVLFERLVPTDVEFLNDLLAAEKQRISSVGLESSSSAILLTRGLRALGYPVAVFDTRRARKFLSIRRNKTDKNDARGMADLVRLGRESVSQVRVKSTDCQRLRSLLCTRQKMMELRVATEAHMRSLFRLNGGRLKSSSSAVALTKNVTSELARIRKLRKIDLDEEVRPLLALTKALRTYLEAIDKKLSKIAADNAVCQKFMAITGVGPLCALAFYSTIEDPRRFRRNADVGPYLGMVPLVRQSGHKSTTCRITKMGDRMTRTYLVTAALHHLRFGNSALNVWGANLTKRTGKGKAQVAVARKLAVIMVAMWKANLPYDPGRGLVNAMRLTEKSISG